MVFSGVENGNWTVFFQQIMEKSGLVNHLVYGPPWSVLCWLFLWGPSGHPGPVSQPRLTVFQGSQLQMDTAIN